MRHDESIDNFARWQGQWEKAMEDGVFDDAPRPAFLPPDEGEENYATYFPKGSKKETQDVDGEYWNRMRGLSKGPDDAPDPLEPDNSSLEGETLETITEDKDDDALVPTEKPDGKSNREITDELGPTANPTNRTNRGIDNRRHVTPNWAGGRKIIELHNMKMNLYKLESKLAADPMIQDKKSKAVVDQIEALWRNIDKLSDSLNPDFTREYQD